MADQDFNIKVVTTADTTGLRQTADEMARLRQQGLLSPIPPELSGAGNGEKIAEEMEKAGGNSLFLGSNLSRARQEAAFLVRELATGVPTTRTLSSLLGSLGYGIAGAAIAGFALNKAISFYGENQLKINRELDAQLTKLTESAQKWKEIAQAATSMEDVGKLASAVLPSIDAAQAKFREFQNAGTTWYQDLADSLLKIPGIVGGPFEKAFQDQASKLAETTQRIRDQATAAINLGEEYTKAFDAKKAEPFEQAITELNQKLVDHLQLQKQIGASNPESWGAEERIIENVTSQINQLTAAHDKLTNKTQKYIETADPQVKAILANEKAMFEARAQGREQDASAFERSAQGLRAGARPDQLAEVNKIYSGKEVIDALNQINVNQRTLIDLWR